MPAESTTSPQSPHPVAHPPSLFATRPQKSAPTAAAVAAAAGGKKLRRKKVKKKDDNATAKVNVNVNQCFLTCLTAIAISKSTV